jgi:hypothetical protein
MVHLGRLPKSFIARGDKVDEKSFQTSRA